MSSGSPLKADIARCKPGDEGTQKEHHRRRWCSSFQIGSVDVIPRDNDRAVRFCRSQACGPQLTIDKGRIDRIGRFDNPCFTYSRTSHVGDVLLSLSFGAEAQRAARLLAAALGCNFASPRHGSSLSRAVAIRPLGLVDLQCKAGELRNLLNTD
jgi:hypothetical protein